MPSQFADKTRINTNATTQIKTSAGLIHRLLIIKPGTAWVIDIYDHASANSNQIASFSPTATGYFEFKVKMGYGIRVVTSGTTAGEVLVVWE